MNFNHDPEWLKRRADLEDCQNINIGTETNREQMNDITLTDQQKRDLAAILHVAWRRYTDLLGEPPHGTLPQMNALVELMRLDVLIKGIGNRAVSKWYAEGQGTTPESES